MDPGEVKENSEEHNYNRTVDDVQSSYMRDKIIQFLTKQKEFFDKLLTRTIFKIPNVFGSEIVKICQREKVDVPLILTQIFS